jgi:UDP-N-acetyl-D-mannosaminuronic acid transferase (WecB/TagA/CpsF family)
MEELRAFPQMGVAAEAAPPVTPEGFAFFVGAERGVSFHPDRVEVHIAAQFQKVAVRVHQNGFVTPLKKMAAAVVAAVDAACSARPSPR